MKYRLKVKKCSFGLLSAGKLKTQRQNEQGHGKSQEYKEDEYAYLINSCVSLLFTLSVALRAVRSAFSQIL